MSYGTLYLCATPIGNLQDITLRVLETLKTVDLVACEDTRKTLQLLNHFEISKPVTSYYEHNKMSKGDVIIQQLKDGKNIALVSDAGMPGISDPGYDLVQQCLAEDIPFTVLPGAVAAVTGLVLSGLPTDRFSFEGFIPRQKKERLQYFQNLVQEERTMIFYESPHRLEDTLKTLISPKNLRKSYAVHHRKYWPTLKPKAFAASLYYYSMVQTPHHQKSEALTGQ